MNSKKESHNYDHSHVHTDKTNIRNIRTTLFMNLGFAIFEIIVGIFTNSVALISNSIHDFGDSIILLSTLNIEKYSQRGRDKNYTYGYRRFSMVGAIINSLVLVVGSTLILITALNRIVNPEEIKSGYLLFFAIFGFTINLFGSNVVGQNKDAVGNAIKKNLLFDALSWLVILIGSIIIYFTNYYFIDSLLSMLIAITMLISVFMDLKDIFFKLMQSVPKDVDYDEIMKIITSHEEILDCHDLHIWDLDGVDYISTFHIVVADDVQEEEIMMLKENLKGELEKYKINHSTIEVDTKTQAILNHEYLSR